MKKLLLIALLSVLTATVGHAANDGLVVDGVVYEWYENSIAHEYGYMAAGWDEKTPIQSLHIRGQVGEYQVFGIANGAFEDNEDIVYLTIDEGITSIGQNAFFRCSNIEVAILPEGLEIIEEEAFAFCTSLTTMVIPSTVTEIQAHAFSECTGVTDVYFLMEDSQLQDFEGWWDGIFRDASNVGAQSLMGRVLQVTTLRMEHTAMCHKACLKHIKLQVNLMNGSWMKILTATPCRG